MYIRGFSYHAALINLFLSQDPLRLSDSDSQPANNNPLDDKFNTKVNWVLEHYKIPGLAISVVHDGKTFAKGYGVSDLNQSTPVTPHTLFFGGSTTKAFTAAAISLLVDDNEEYPHIQWDTPVHSLIPEDFAMSDPYQTTHVTLTDILSHRSGLPRHDIVLLQNSTAQEMVHRIRHLPTTAEIRTTWQYCNLMYITAGHIVESVTGSPLEAFLREKIWTPLGMNETYLSLSPALNDGHHVSEGYFTHPVSGTQIPTKQTYSASDAGAANILTSVSDYSKWLAAFLHASSPPLSETAYAALLGAHSVVSPRANPPFAAPELYGRHSGAQSGYGALVAFLPGQSFGVAILGNNMLGVNAGSNVLAFDLIDRVLGVKEGERWDWQSTGDEQLALSKTTNDTLAALYPDLRDGELLLPHPLNVSSYTGTYTHPAYPSISISTDCPDRTPLNNPEKWTGVRLCGTLVNPVAFPSEFVLDFFHVSGTYWTLVGGFGELSYATRVEFRIAPQGSVSEVGVEFDPIMQGNGGKIWLRRTE